MTRSIVDNPQNYCFFQLTSVSVQQYSFMYGYKPILRNPILRAIGNNITFTDIFSYKCRPRINLMNKSYYVGFRLQETLLISLFI
jgi:hypothetical protein